MIPNNLVSSNTAPEQEAEVRVKHNSVVCHHYSREGLLIAFKCMEEVVREQEDGMENV